MPGIDSAILDLTEWLCQRFQVLTGRTNVWIAVQLTNLSIIVYFFSAAIYFQALGLLGARIAVALFCSGVAYVLTQTVFKESIKSAESSAYARVAKGLRNPRRLRDAPLRMSFLTMSVLMLYPLVFIYMAASVFVTLLPVYIALLSYSLIALTTVLLYVIACDPLPPCVGRVRVWLRGAAAQRIPARELPVPDSRGVTSSCHGSDECLQRRVGTRARDGEWERRRRIHCGADRGDLTFRSYCNWPRISPPGKSPGPVFAGRTPSLVCTLT